MSRVLLKNDIVLRRENGSSVNFHIKAHIGSGASCVVYHAEGDDNTEHLLKEYYPRNLELERADDGTIIVPVHKKEQFDKGLVRFRSGNERQKKVRLSEKLKNYTSNVQGYFYGNGTEYIDMTVFAGRTYNEIETESLYTLMLRMRTLAQVIGYYHDAGLLHLDIKPDNIFVRRDGETVEDVMLFDFDSVVENSEKMTVPALSYTKDWAAPEQLLPYKRSSICAATDLFAIGEILFAKIFGRHSTDAERRSFVTRYSYDHNAKIFENVNPKVFPLLDDLLCHTICGVVRKRYPSADELIKKLDEIIEIANPTRPYLKSSLPAVRDFFVGRENEIAQIHQKLSENNILFLYGIGGIGKSELSKHYALKYKDDYDAIIFAPYISDVNMLLQDDTAIPLYNFSQYPEEKPAEYRARKFRKLQQLCDERTLLIIDNLDREDDPELTKLLDLGCKMLITTRIDFSDYGYGQQLYLDTLCSRDSIRAIFDKYYTKPLTAEENTCVEQIIEWVAGHTMTVELLAKQMMAGRVKPDKMLAKLQDGGIGESGKEKVRSGKDGVLDALSAYDHIRALFDLSELGEDERYILANLSLIPYTGISVELFHDWCELQDYDCINELAVHGWVRLEEEKDYISLHPVIGEVMQEEIEKDCSVCDKLFEGATHFLEDEADTILKDASLISTINHIGSKICQKEILSSSAFALVGEIIFSLSDFISLQIYTKYWKTAISCYEDDFPKTAVPAMYTVLGYLYHNEDMLVDAEKTYLVALNALKSTPKTDTDTAVAIYRGLGALYQDMDLLDNAKKMQKTALAISVDTFGEHHEKTAVSYADLGDLFLKTGDYKEAKEYYEKALHILLRSPTPPQKIAYCYHNIGAIYREMNQFQKAEEYIRLALKVIRETLGEENLSIASVYDSLGKLYHVLNRFFDAEQYCLQALRLRQTILGEYHSQTAISYLNLSSLYRDQANYPKAAIYCTKALPVYYKIYGKDHSAVANAYSHFGTLHLSLRDYHSAMKYYEQALTIRKALYGENHPDTVQTTFDIGNLYYKQGVYKKAEVSFWYTLLKFHNLYGNEHSKTAASYMRLASVYLATHRYDLAETFYKMTLFINHKVFGELHVEIAEAYVNLGMLYHQINRDEEAEQSFVKALEIREKLFGEKHPMIADVYQMLGDLYQDQNKYDLAKSYLSKALDIYQDVYSQKPHDRIASAYSALGKTYALCGDTERAGEYYEKALSIRRQIYGDDHEKVRLVQDRIRELSDPQ